MSHAPGADRMPLPRHEELSQAQREAAVEIASGPRGAVIGPFVPLLRSPELMRRVQRVGEHLRFESTGRRDLYELVVLTVARAFDQEFEWSHHAPLAMKAGLAPEVVAAIGRGERPSPADPDLVLVWDVATALLAAEPITDDIYDAFVALIGEKAAIDLVATIGYYSMLAIVMNFANTPAEPSEHRLPDRAR